MGSLSRGSSIALVVVPGGLTAYFAFNGGGFFPGAQAFASLLLLQILVLRIAMAEDPFAGAGRRVVVVVVALSAFAALILASSLWSDAPGRALLELNRALPYLL